LSKRAPGGVAQYAALRIAQDLVACANNQHVHLGRAPPVIWVHAGGDVGQGVVYIPGL
jgi:hypothetical protein